MTRLTNAHVTEVEKLLDKYLMVSAGCTEPIAIAYAASVARANLEGEPATIHVSLSSNMAKNAMDAGVPNSKYVGAAFVAAEGGLFGDHNLGFELLRDIPEDKQLVAYNFSKENVSVDVADTTKPLYISITMRSMPNACCCCNEVQVVVEDSHDSVKSITRNGEVLYAADESAKEATTSNTASGVVSIGMEEIFEYANTTDNLDVFKQAIALDTAISDHGKEVEYGLNVGKAKPFGEDTTFSKIISTTTAAVDARMGGAPYSVMACTGSGNQGLTTTLPVVEYARSIGATEDKTLRAVAVADLAAMFVKKELSVLSHLCGAVIASTGASAGLVYLMGGDYKQAEYAMQNVMGAVTGMFCDGAKSTCAMKVCACISTAIYAATMAMSGQGCITKSVGIVNEEVRNTVLNIAKIEKDSAEVMNKTILEIIVR